MKKMVNGELVDLTPAEELEMEQMRDNSPPIPPTRDIFKELDDLKSRVDVVERRKP